ncbi:putative methyltransferase [Gordonia hirsuta DSM 44140 = NBRC 16056]|uniref:Putative methyltransferase n=1 Tax=Gordonia hirsuta DSM 44140 = NBRC 16056 TaxID=1121927 RepID=L7L4U9_9ACTN|nr:class I SAM-dependent methyltransferase [Gordonia hirsuta]GAC55954.1 putative methyltransferase [Gordonia hirsuta DSM 44140 = NBRC 16056]
MAPDSPRPPRVLGDIDSATSESASRSWWDGQADDYQAEHGSFLGNDVAGGDFVWGPERLREEEAGLLGDVSGLDVLEIGCGAAPCARWMTARGARVVGLDVSAGMLTHAVEAMRADARPVPLVLAGAEQLPFADASFDLVTSAFGAVPFVADSAQLMREASRVLRPGGRWVFATNHPMRWMFLDDPGPEGLLVQLSYFNRTPYSETDADGNVTYVEHHRTMGDRIREIVAAGLVVEDVVEPEWPDDLDAEWGQWSPLRGALFPGTAIFVTRKPAGAA